jgi:hypothetical protein
MKRIIANLDHRRKAIERRIEFAERAREQGRFFGTNVGGLANRRQWLLKEVATLTLAIEALRQLESKEIRPVGALTAE